ncbi:family B DNA polymerase, partial [Streptococcus pyogenes]
PVTHYIDQAAWHLHLQTGKDYSECEAYVKRVIKNRELGHIKNPVVKFLKREENGDRSPQETTLTNYFKEVLRDKEILAPTFTSYIS